jgi:hypothetical protein
MSAAPVAPVAPPPAPCRLPLHLARGAPLLLLALACGAPVEPPSAACEARLPGDVVLTELMRDPGGVDTGREWLELHNPTAAPLPLDGLELVVSRADGTQERSHRLAQAPVLAPGGYVALGDVRAGAALPAHLAYSWGEALGSLPNAEGRVSVRCADRVLDALAYAGEGRPGVALQLDGARAPEATANDTPGALCEAPLASVAGMLGSPGAPNPPCPRAAGADGGTAAPAPCRDARTGQPRAPRPPAPGALRLAEVMANPAAADDAAGEWVELHALQAADLAGLSLALGPSGTPAALAGEGCMEVEAGAHVLLARTAASATNGGLPPVRATFPLALPNAGGTLVLRAGAVQLDALAFPAREAGRAGVASQVDPAALLPAGAPPRLCDATAATPGGERGTPGAANTPCPADAPADGGGAPPAAGTCVDGRTGATRASVAPAPGDVVLHELMVDPLGTDAEREYVEVLATREVDLNGLVLASGSAGGRSTLSATACLTVPAGGLALLARRADASLNGGLPPPLALFDVALANAAAAGEPDRQVQLWWGAQLLDEVRYRDSQPGVAAQLRAGHRTPAGNDAPAAFCTSASAPAYGEGGRGTPGGANVCP